MCFSWCESNGSASDMPVYSSHSPAQIVDPPVRLASPHQLRQRLGKRAEPLLASPQRGLRLVPGMGTLFERNAGRVQCIADLIKFTNPSGQRPRILTGA